MSDTRGVFRLLEVVENKLEDTWVPLDEVFTAPSPAGTPVRFTDGATPSPNTGYFGGGGPGTGASARSTMEKVTYSSDTTAAVPTANLIFRRNFLAATGNSTAGYFGGGNAYPIQRSTMEKVTYASDTGEQVPGAALSSTRYLLAATGNSTAGYFGGGITEPGSIHRTTMDKVTYSSDTRSTVPGAALSVGRRGLAATGNSDAGYFGGGLSPGSAIYSTMDKVTYSSDTTAAVPGANLSVDRWALAALSSRANALPTSSSVIV